MNAWNLRKSYDAKARLVKTQSDEEAAHYDRARILNSSAFRRLQGKTQVLNIGESDFYRNRLTHSLEVAQIATGILLELKKQVSAENMPFLPNANLIEAIGCAHDIGHPAFGHDGERTLNYCMQEHGGFEGNGQTLRILTKLGEYSFNNGFDLTRRTLLGVIKYPIFYSDAYNPNVGAEKPPKCLLDSERDIFEWIIEPFSESDKKQFCTINKENPEKHYQSLYKSLDCSIMELADDITYGVHDFEDMLAMKLITKEDWDKYVVTPLLEKGIKCPLTDKESKYGLDFYRTNFFSKKERERKWAVSMIIGYFIKHSILISQKEFESPLLKLNVDLQQDAKIALQHVTELVFNNVIATAKVRTLEYKSRKLIRELFDVLSENPLFMGDYYFELYQQEKKNPNRIVCDFIAGMTDNAASKLYQRLFIPDMGSIYGQ